jgi:hypothetical protein
VEAESPKQHRAGWLWLTLLCIVGFAHALAYAITNPVFESPDEPGHLAYINHIAAGGGMPDQYDPKQFLAEGHQSPLYYFFFGEILRATSGPIYAALSESKTPAPAPKYDHRSKPFHSSRDRIAFYALRFFGCLFVALTVLQTGRAAKMIMPVGHVYLIAPMIIALLPQFAFVGASISNDGIASLIGACATFAAAQCAMNPEERKHWISLGIWIGVAFLAKKNALAFVPAFLVLIGVLATQNSVPIKRLILNGLFTFLGSFLMSLPILLRNISLYDDILGNRMEVETLSSLAYTQSLNSMHFRMVFPDSVPRSFVSHFGWMSVEVKQRFVWPVVRILLSAFGVGLVGLIDRKRTAIASFCVAAFLANVIGLVYYNMMFPQAQGRLLFPTLAPFAIVCAIGFFEVSRRIAWKYKAYLLAPIFIAFLWFDMLCFWTNQNFYAWFGPKLGF